MQIENKKKNKKKTRNYIQLSAICRCAEGLIIMFTSYIYLQNTDVVGGDINNFKGI